MNILVIGGTRFFSIHMVNELLTAGHDVTIATRGKASDSFGDKVDNGRNIHPILWGGYEVYGVRICG